MQCMESCYNYSSISNLQPNSFFFLLIGKPSHVSTERFRHIQSVVGFIRKCIVFVVVLVLFYWTKRLLSLKVNSKDIIYSKIGQDIFLFAIPSICFGKSRNLFAADEALQRSGLGCVMRVSPGMHDYVSKCISKLQNNRFKAFQNLSSKIVHCEDTVFILLILN